MKKFLLGGVALVALAAGDAASAADMPIGKAPPPVWNWTGGYVGVHIGAQAGRTDFSDPYGSAVFGDYVRTPGFLAGGQIGYNWQVPSSTWVFGVEFDASGITSNGTNTCFAVSTRFLSSDCYVHPNATATLTGRIGQALGPDGRTLLYAKGGLAFVHNNIDIHVGGNAGFGNGGPINIAPATSSSYWRAGGTVGGGIERALTPAWSFRVVYDYLRFADATVATPPTVRRVPPLEDVPGSTTNVGQDLHHAKVSLNYRLGADPWAGWPSAAPAYPVKGPVYKASPGWTPGWEFEAGTRIWYSTGSFAWSITQPSPISRLAYDDLQGPAGELYQRLDSPWNWFVKSHIGLGAFKGHMNDEDWNGFGGAIYGNTLSDHKNGKLGYATADLGYNVLRGPGYKVGPFVGYHYLDQRGDTYGCTQIASPPQFGTGCFNPTVPTSVLIGQQQSTWQAIRVGLAGETMLGDRWRLTGEVAYLPWVKMKGRDNHLLRTETTYFEQWGDQGRGVHLEGAVSYFVTNHWTVGIGGRYWAMWTTEAYDQIYVNAAPAFGVATARFDTSRLGVFVQSSFKFDWTDGVKASN
jgi:opacity protein-like surface antigen/outer membrane protease